MQKKLSQFSFFSHSYYFFFVGVWKTIYFLVVSQFCLFVLLISHWSSSSVFLFCFRWRLSFDRSQKLARLVTYEKLRSSYGSWQFRKVQIWEKKMKGLMFQKPCLIWLLHPVKLVLLQATEPKLVLITHSNTLLPHQLKPRRKRETFQATQVFIYISKVPSKVFFGFGLFVVCPCLVYLNWVYLFVWFGVRIFLIVYSDPEAEVVALSPKTLLATNRFICEICNKGFQRDQNLQLHRRGHNLPWKLKQRTSKEIRKKVYVCPEASCVHHDPSRALGDLTGIKKHFCRKHGEKKWKCDKCSKKYAVQSDWKAHSKTCGTREYRCDCGTLFSR